MLDGLWRLILQQKHEQKQSSDQGRSRVYRAYKGSGGGERRCEEAEAPFQSPCTDSDRIWKAVTDTARGL
jgi:hypothetical protein